MVSLTYLYMHVGTCRYVHVHLRKCISVQKSSKHLVDQYTCNILYRYTYSTNIYFVLFEIHVHVYTRNYLSVGKPVCVGGGGGGENIMQSQAYCKNCVSHTHVHIIPPTHTLTHKYTSTMHIASLAGFTSQMIRKVGGEPGTSWHITDIILCQGDKTAHWYSRRET